ncbi:hypothetical protein EV426DRAFT_707325 [Tirmania nivea]|nr:hypothetical protein EV426DRAFT_707325 [Tirmania nivea]
MPLFGGRSLQTGGLNEVSVHPAKLAGCVSSPIPLWFPQVKTVIQTEKPAFPENATPSSQNTVASFHLPPRLKELWLTLIFNQYNPLKEHMMSILPGLKKEGITIVNKTRWKLFNRLMDQAGHELIPHYSRKFHPSCIFTMEAYSEWGKQMEEKFRAEFMEMCFEEKLGENDGPTRYQLRRELEPEPPDILVHQLLMDPLLEVKAFSLDHSLFCNTALHNVIAAYNSGRQLLNDDDKSRDNAYNSANVRDQGDVKVLNVEKSTVSNGKGESKEPKEALRGKEHSSPSESTLGGAFKPICTLYRAMPGRSVGIGPEWTILKVPFTKALDVTGSSGVGSHYSDETASEHEAKTIECDDGLPSNEVPKWERFWHSVNIEEHLFTDPVEVVWGRSASDGNPGAWGSNVQGDYHEGDNTWREWHLEGDVIRGRD